MESSYTMKNKEAVLSASAALKEAGISCKVSAQSLLVLIINASDPKQVMKAESICNPIPEPDDVDDDVDDDDTDNV